MLHAWYTYKDPDTGERRKGGTIEFLFRHANAISRALAQKWDDNGNLVWGQPLKDRIKSYFTEARYLRFEVFNDLTPVDDCFVSLDPEQKDKWGMPVARIRLGYPDCRAHELENLYVTDGSFMPIGGSVPHTWTIYANAFRVAERIVEALGGPSSRFVD